MFRNALEKIFARFYDAAMAKTEREGLGERRAQLLKDAKGEVIDIGAGTGVNIDAFDSAQTIVTYVEPSAPMAKRLRMRLDANGSQATVVQAGAEAVPLPDGSFDTAVSTLVLCTVDDPDRSLAELHRLLRPGGRLLFIEHVRSEDPGSARWQDRLAPAWRIVGNGCNCNRDTAASIARAGFTIDSIEHGEMPAAPPVVRPMIWGTATRA